jgi:hypothetical protein
MLLLSNRHAAINHEAIQAHREQWAIEGDGTGRSRNKRRRQGR